MIGFAHPPSFVCLQSDCNSMSKHWVLRPNTIQNQQTKKPCLFSPPVNLRFSFNSFKMPSVNHFAPLQPIVTQRPEQSEALIFAPLGCKGFTMQTELDVSKK
ncbi:hypothetical protein J3458_021683 [Metarhizium acridum]|uniref:uncharacterized protein n=1 Tax=Metarhizium acridum TaxID=92637 RepID=UPI001C6AEFFC|nr:hypothetical protein J3458_021683 [Metarhizium acridum]